MPSETDQGQNDTVQDQSVPLQEQGESNSTEDISDSLASPFLEQIPEADRETVARYVKGWDAQVTNKFQQVHDQYKPYKDLGDVETLTQAQQLYNLVENDPEQVYRLLADQYGSKETPSTQATQPSQDDIFSQLPEPLQQKFATLDKHDQVLEMMAQDFIKRQEADKQAAEEKELDAYMGNLQKKHGDFDQEYVLMKMSNGMDGDKAVKAWNTMLQTRLNKSNEASSSAPSNILSGGGGFATTGKDINSLTPNETQQLVVKMLEQRARENQ